MNSAGRNACGKSFEMKKGLEMTFEHILELMDKFDASGITSFELKQDDITIRLKSRPTVPMTETVANPVKENTNTEEVRISTPQVTADYIKAPLVGVYYAASSPDKAPFVKVGSKVEKGETVCLIEAMKMMSEVVAPRAGTIKEILIENGNLVEFDQPLFVLE